MKAVVLHQPYATLVALGVKTIETRPSPPNGPMRPAGVRGLPGLPIEAGERIAIIAGAKAPKDGATFGDWGIAERRWPRDAEWELQHYAEGCPGAPDSVPLPLGAVVCTVVVAEALPMYADLKWDDEGGIGVFGAGISLEQIDDGVLALLIGDLFGVGGEDVSDQLPFGDFAPGRWGWLLTDVEPCAPVPVKGRQGVFRLPDGVTAQIGAPA